MKTNKLTHVMVLAIIAATSSASAQTTRSEKLAAGIEAPSQEDKILKREHCAPLGAFSKPLPIETFPISPVYEVVWPEFLFLPLTDTHLAEGGGEGLTVSQWPYLPHGGISGVDICAIGVLHALSEPTPDQPNQFRIGLALRPSLKIETDYPSAHRILEQQVDRLTSIPEGAYLVYKMLDEDKVERAAAFGRLLADNTDVSQALVLGNWLFVRKSDGNK